MTRDKPPADDWQRVWDAFHDVLVADASQRTTLLEGLRPALRREVESLLAAHDDAGTFLESPPQAAIASSEGPLLGSRIGPYRLLRPLGAGGMGLVYLAEQQEPFHRQVALKLIHPRLLASALATDQEIGVEGSTSPTLPGVAADVAARFDAERQALALLRHPGIATLYDTGSMEDGAPWMAMEYVEGLPLDVYCQTQGDENHGLDLDARLRLLHEVCRAVGHAHARGIVHRDLKPSNILVTRVDGEAAVKVIDFGIAKALALPLGEVRTRAGQYLGTPAYASPEQRTGGPVDARADVYALGLILRRLLEPLGPPPAWLRRVLERALAADPARRFADAAMLGRALAEGNAQRRHRRWLAAAVLSLLVLVLGLAWMNRDARSTAPGETQQGSVNTPMTEDSPTLDDLSEENSHNALLDRIEQATHAPSPFSHRALALTFDDVPDNGELPRARLEAMNSALLQHLRAHGAPATAFVDSATLTTAPRLDLLGDWLEAGHTLGNHAAGHPHFRRTRFDAYAASIERADTALRAVLRQHSEAPPLRAFRPPYLETGSDAASRARLDSFLASHDYRLVLATIEVLDYLYADAWDHHPDEHARLRTAYLQHVEDRLAFAERSAQDLFDRDIAQVMLLHAYPLNAELLDDLLQRLQARGYRFVSLDEAMRDPVYALPDTSTSEDGLSWLPRWAETLGQVYDFAGEPEAPAWVLELTGS